MAASLSLVAGGGEAVRASGARPRLRAAFASPFPEAETGAPFVLPGAGLATLAEVFAVHPGDAGWIGFLTPQLVVGKPLLWVQERMAILESGRLHPAALGPLAADLIHVEARDARSALWAMEEGLRCGALGAVIGELAGDPAALDFTATRRLAVAAERNGVAAYLVRVGGNANLSGARWRWRVASAPSLANPLNRRAPGQRSWRAELFRGRGVPPGEWRLADDRAGAEAANPFRLVAEPGDRALDEAPRARA